MTDDRKKISRAALIAAAVFAVATLAVLVMQTTPKPDIPPAASYGEARTPSGPNNTPDVKDARRSVRESGQPANTGR